MKIKPSPSSNVATDAETLVNLTSEIARLQALVEALQQKDTLAQAHAELAQKHAVLSKQHATLSQKHSTLEQNWDELQAKFTTLTQSFAGIKQRLAWFEKQLFGQKSEKRALELGMQLSLLGDMVPALTQPEGETEYTTYTRRKGKQRPDDCVNDSGLRFNDNVPVKVITLIPDELKGEDADKYEVIGVKSTFRLAQRPASFEVLRYDRQIVKHKESEAILPSKAPFNVLDKSCADVSFIVGMLVDKFQYHLPLYRQHQRLAAAGITLSRSTLGTIVARGIDLLYPIVDAMLTSILQSQVLAMDETPIKAGKAGPGKMKQSYFWPVYGDKDEIVFTFSTSRGRQHIEEILKHRFKGTLLSDGYSAYASYIKANEGLTHAQCWVHSRRQFIEAENSWPQPANEAISLIAKLYEIEETIQRQKLTDDKKRQYRLTHSKPVVDRFFQWCDDILHNLTLLPKDPLYKAIGYVQSKEMALRVFLEAPDVPLDTNHLERALRSIPMGRKNWLFCWTEIGAEHVGVIQSLIVTCRLHDINVNDYLTDVLLRISQHPASQVHELTPQYWKTKFADNPLRSDLFALPATSVE
ncbi:IS66 family transposase [Shewanella sp. GD03713]|uniref:IS66 family transposase n=1 Tax=Shewanella sp. GD03713 TaxID=2975372 RepID=UPI00244763BC|nr:IS66 family transposase [Shewanella sp. GD03713]MDH1468836.1 IS66 family transposase [Shewanella sp. GD03713]MDH1469742.1 IS66 family transposase [Shewanella sp. GD03713]